MPDNGIDNLPNTDSYEALNTISDEHSSTNHFNLVSWFTRSLIVPLLINPFVFSSPSLNYCQKLLISSTSYFCIMLNTNLQRMTYITHMFTKNWNSLAVHSLPWNGIPLWSTRITWQSIYRTEKMLYGIFLTEAMRTFKVFTE